MSSRGWITPRSHVMTCPARVIPRQTGSRVSSCSYYILPMLENVANLILHWVHMQMCNCPLTLEPALVSTCPVSPSYPWSISV